MRLSRFVINAFLLLPASSYALYVGCPALPEMPETGFFIPKDSAVALKIGYEGDYLLGRTLDISSPGSNPGMNGMLNGAVLTLDFINRIEVYTLLGASETKVSFNTQGPTVKLKTAQNFGGEVGIRANTPIWGELKFGVDAKYLYVWPTLSQVKVGGESLSSSGRVFQKEWQIAGAVSQTFAFVTPYVGVKFSKFSMEFIDVTSLNPWIASNRIDINNKGPFGIFLGLGFATQKGFYADIEGRFIDECALTGALGMSF